MGQTATKSLPPTLSPDELADWVAGQPRLKGYSRQLLLAYREANHPVSPPDSPSQKGTHAHDNAEKSSISQGIHETPVDSPQRPEARRIVPLSTAPSMDTGADRQKRSKRPSHEPPKSGVFEDFPTGKPPYGTDVKNAGCPRLSLPEGIDEETFASAHGELIAFGYLAFDLNSGSGGIVYRPTREGLGRLRQEESPTAT